MQWFFSEQYSYEPNIATVRHWLAHFGRYLAEPPFLGRRRNGEAVLDLMDSHLAERAFFLGDDFTIDGIAYVVSLAEGFEVNLLSAQLEDDDYIWTTSLPYQ